MASTITITSGANSTPPDGTVIATDENATATHYQIVKLADGTKGSNTVIPGDGDGLYVQGSIAHDGVDAALPLKVGMKSINHGTNPTSVAASDVSDWYASRAGIPWVIGGHPNVVTIGTAYTAADTDAHVLAGVANIRTVVTQLTVHLDEATTVGVGATIYFGTGPPAIGATGVLLNTAGLIPGGGVVRGDGSGILGISAAAADTRIWLEAPTSGQLLLTMSYYTINEA